MLSKSITDFCLQDTNRKIDRKQISTSIAVFDEQIKRSEKHSKKVHLMNMKISSRTNQCSMKDRIEGLKHGIEANTYKVVSSDV